LEILGFGEAQGFSAYLVIMGSTVAPELEAIEGLDH